MKAAIEARLRRLGPAGVLGIGVLLACAGFWLSALQPLEEELAARRLVTERLASRSPYRPISLDRREDELRRFQGLFPAAGDLTDEVERLHDMGRRAGLLIANGEYRLERHAGGALWGYRVTLPVSGTYRQLRDFVSAVLKDMPVASIDALRFERKRATDAELEAQVRLTIHVRPSGDPQ